MIKLNPPFALDDDCDSVYSMSSVRPESVSSNTTCRRGGPKEARLKRVALLSKTKETDHLYPVKIANIPRTASSEQLIQNFSEFGDIGDVYIPTNLKDGRAAKDFAVVRFVNEKSALEAIEKADKIKQIGGNPLSLSPLSKQKSSFTMGTGYLGITNEPFDDGQRYKAKGVCAQDISLDSCMSRSGYPWGSVRELKFLAPHAPPAALDMFTMKVTNLAKHTTPKTLREVFSRYGEVGDVNCPKPLLVTEQIKEPNSGFAFIRYADKRDIDKAVADVRGGLIEVDGKILNCEVIPPKFWPTEKTRRYY